MYLPSEFGPSTFPIQCLWAPCLVVVRRQGPMQKLGKVSRHQGLSIPHLVRLWGWKTPASHRDLLSFLVLSPFPHQPPFCPATPVSSARLLSVVSSGKEGLYPASSQVDLGHPASECAVGTYTGVTLLLAWPCRLPAEKNWCLVGLVLRCQKLINELLGSKSACLSALWADASGCTGMCSGACACSLVLPAG